MYARYFTFKSTPENRKRIEAMADQIYGFTKSLKGFSEARYLVSEDECTYGSVTLWDSKEDAVAAGARILEQLGNKLQGLATEPPEIAVFEVYDPGS